MSQALDERHDELINGAGLSGPRDQPEKASDTTSIQQPSSSSASASPFLQPTKRSATAPASSTTSSAAPSPKPSRDASPDGPLSSKAGQNNAPRTARSRKNSQDMSPHRLSNSTGQQIQDTPSAAAVQRGLAAASRLASPANSDQSSEPQKQRQHRSSRSPANQNSANTSSRVRSPPSSIPSGRGSVHATRKHEQEQTSASAPKIVVDETAAKPTPKHFDTIAEEEDGNRLPTGMRSPPRQKSPAGILEVVHESSLPETPAIGNGFAIQNGKPRTARSSTKDSRNKDGPTQASTTQTESGSESGGTKSSVNTRKDAGSAQKPVSAAKPAPLKATNSFTQLTNSRSKPAGDGSIRNMTVETETVTSVPSTSVGAAGQRELSARSDGASLRLKPSSETIRPKKEKKKTVRKAPSVHSGTAPDREYKLAPEDHVLTRSKASSKADIFEAKVASAVDEADSSDSAETFVYESNPPEPYSRPSRYHSRTPSAASVASQADHYGGRYRSDGHHSIVGKRSMKFSNNSHHLNGHQGDGENGSHGAVVGSGRGSVSNGAQYHHHIGRHGRAVAHASIVDSDSPFTSKSKSSHNTKHGKGVVGSNSPRSPFPARSSTNGKFHKAAYNLDDDVADDERTPLINPRNSRVRPIRRPGARYDQQRDTRSKGLFGGVLCWLLLGLLVIILVVGIAIALILCSKPLTSVKVRDLANVIASEEELVFDLHVHAMNKNIIPIQVNKLDMKVFAKSKYVGSTRRIDGANSQTLSNDSYHKQDGVDKGTDPIDGDSETMLLGRLSFLDSPLIFEASPTGSHLASDSASVSLSYPGNSTAEDGSNRWKTVVQHSFELIVVGQLKYNLPISSKLHSVSFGQGKTTVDPDEPVSDDSSCLYPFNNCRAGVRAIYIAPRRQLQNDSKI